MRTDAASVDFITQGAGGIAGQGSVAMKLMQSNFNVQSLRPQGVLRKDEWVHFDNAILNVARHRLVGVADLISRGLTYNVPNAMGITKIEWERVGDMEPAELSMAAVTPGQNDRLEFDLQSMPLPIVHKDFWINARVLAASRNGGQPLDTMQAEVAARKVAELVESMLWSGNTTLGTNNTIYGYTTAPNRNTGSVTASWVTATGAQIVGDVMAMIAKAIADNMFGPYVLYVPTAVHTHLGDDYKSESDKTILQRVKEIPGIADVRPSYYLSGTNIILVQMSREVVDMVMGLQPTMVQWDTHGGFVMNFKVLAIMVPRLRSDKLTQSGIVHYS